ncbi:hsp70-binding protein 1 isoform 2-T3 [Cochliomyia hominivorax]
MDSTVPKHLQDLLKIAISQQQNAVTECVQIDENKKKFLDCVLQSMSVNVVQEFLKAIRILQDGSTSDEEKCDALDIIRDYIDNIDFANSFVKIEGADILINCAKHSSKLVCQSALSIIAEMSQNNPFCQQYFQKYNIVELLLQYLTNDDQELIAIALYSLSALVRNFEPALVEVIKKGGVRHVTNCLSSDSSRVFTKACFLLISMSSYNNIVKDEFVKLEAFKKLSNKLRIISDYDVEIEMALNAMSILLKSRYCDPSKHEKECIVNILNKNIMKIKKLPECEEIVTYSNSVLCDLENRNELDSNN